MVQKQRSEAPLFDIEPHVGRRLADVERDLIIATLTRCGGNRTWAAEILGICVRTLRNKLITYDSAAIPPAKTGRMTTADEDNWLSQLERYEPGRRVPS